MILSICTYDGAILVLCTKINQKDSVGFGFLGKTTNRNIYLSCSRLCILT